MSDDSYYPSQVQGSIVGRLEEAERGGKTFYYIHAQTNTKIYGEGIKMGFFSFFTPRIAAPRVNLCNKWIRDRPTIASSALHPVEGQCLTLEFFLLKECASLRFQPFRVTWGDQILRFSFAITTIVMKCCISTIAHPRNKRSTIAIATCTTAGLPGCLEEGGIASSNHSGYRRSSYSFFKDL